VLEIWGTNVYYRLKQIPLNKITQQACLIRPGRNRQRDLDRAMLEVGRIRACRSAAHHPLSLLLLLVDMSNPVRTTLLRRADPAVPDDRLERADEVGEDCVNVVQASKQLDDVGAWIRVLFGENGS
jgi:hypothetical protein